MSAPVAATACGIRKFRGVDAGGVPSALSNDNSGRGWFGTVQVGCDYQVGSNLVIGAFADYDFSGLKGDMSRLRPASLIMVMRSTSRRGRWRPRRLASVPHNSWSTCRAAIRRRDFGQVDVVSIIAVSAISHALRKHTYAGWFIGSGYEYGIGWLPGLFWKTEYRFADYGTDRVPFVST